MSARDRSILLIGSTDGCVDIEYATGFRAPDPVVFLRNRGEGYLVVPEMEYGRADRTGRERGVKVFSPRLLGFGNRRRTRVGDWAVRLVRRLGIRHVTVPSAFPHGVARRLQRAGLRVSVARRDLFPERAVKRRDECAKIREAQQAAVIAMRAAVAAIARASIDPHGWLVAGGSRLTSEAVRRIIAMKLLEHGCQCRDTIVAGGDHAADPHERGHGPLRAGTPIVIDIFPQHLEHGYWGDLTRTVVRGRPAAELRRLYLAVKAAQGAALAAIRPGVSVGAVHRAVVECFRRRGFVSRVENGRAVGFVHSTGHGVGLCIHESPALGAGRERLRSGNVVTVEPGLYYPGLGGVRIEDTVVVVPGGWRYLAPCEKRFDL